MRCRKRSSFAWIGWDRQERLNVSFCEERPYYYGMLLPGGHEIAIYIFGVSLTQRNCVPQQPELWTIVRGMRSSYLGADIPLDPIMKGGVVESQICA